MIEEDADPRKEALIAYQVCVCVSVFALVCV